MPTQMKSQDALKPIQNPDPQSDNEDPIVVSTETAAPRSKHLTLSAKEDTIVVSTHLKSETRVLQARGALQEGTECLVPAKTRNVGKFDNYKNR